MGPEAISLSVRSSGREGSYRFTCPRCDDAVEKRADRKIVALLVSGGHTMLLWVPEWGEYHLLGATRDDARRTLARALADTRLSLRDGRPVDTAAPVTQ